MSQKIEVDVELLKRLAEIAASAINDTISHDVIKDETNASDSEISATAFMFIRFSDGSFSRVPKSMHDFSELILALEKNDFENRYLK